MIEIGLIITGLTEVAKMAGIPAKYLPVLAIIIGGLMGGVGAYFAGGDLNTVYNAILTGVMAGLVTTGLVRRVDHVAKKIGEKPAS